MRDTVFRLRGYWEVTQTGPSELILRRNPPWEEAAPEDCDWVQDILGMSPQKVVDQIACLEPEQQNLLMQQLSTIFGVLEGPARQRPVRCPARSKRLRPEERAAIIDLFNQGTFSKTDIADKVGTTPQTVLKVLRSEGLTPPPRPHNQGTRGWMYY